jgi:hypothetical protein
MYLQTRKLFVNYFPSFNFHMRQSRPNGKPVRQFLQRVQEGPKSCSRDGGEQAVYYLGTWPHFGALLFLRSVIKPRLTKVNIEDPNVSNIHRCCE